MDRPQNWLNDDQSDLDLSEIPQEAILKSETLLDQAGSISMLMKKHLKEHWNDVSGKLKLPACSPIKAAMAENYGYKQPFFREIDPDNLQLQPEKLLQLWYRKVNDEPSCGYEKLVEEGIRLARDGGHLVVLVPGLRYAPQRVRVEVNDGEYKYYPLTDKGKEEITFHDDLYLSVRIGYRGERRIILLRPDGTRFKHYHSMSDQDCTGSMEYDVELKPEPLYQLKKRFEASLKTINLVSLPDQSLNEVGPRNVKYEDDRPIENPIDERSDILGFGSSSDPHLSPMNEEEVEDGIEQIQEAQPALTPEQQTEDWVALTRNELEERSRSENFQENQDDPPGERERNRGPRGASDRPTLGDPLHPGWFLAALGGIAVVAVFADPQTRQKILNDRDGLQDWVEENGRALLNFLRTPVGIVCFVLALYVGLVVLASFLDPRP